MKTARCLPWPVAGKWWEATMAWKGPPRSTHAHEAKTASFQVGDPRNLLAALSCLLVDKEAFRLEDSNHCSPQGKAKSPGALS